MEPVLSSSSLGVAVMLRRGRLLVEVGTMRVYRRLLMLAACLVWLFAVATHGQSGQPQAEQAPATPRQPRPLDPKLLNLTSAGPNRPDEPFAATLSLEKTRNFLDEMAVNWTREKK